MLFSSLPFIFIFFPIVCILYFAVPNRIYKNALLCFASLFFYAWGEPIFVLLMIFSITGNYVAAFFLKNRISFIITIAMNLALLVFFKYANFLIDSFNTVVQSVTKNQLPIISRFDSLTLPIGISFYTFQILSYIIDVYRGKVAPQRSILNLGVYVSLFPQLIAGPIVRYSDIANAISCRKESYTQFISGLKTCMFGLGAKVIIANTMAIIADGILDHYTEAPMCFVWLGVAAYSLQIYFDFYGYSLMAVGIGRMFGFQFPHNFNYPYVATSITDFWRRWHITLSVWFRDYVYIPLGGNRHGLALQLRNILITWILTGLWHGASWNFVLWGLYYAILLILEKFLFTKKIVSTKIFVLLRRPVTLVLVMIGWIIFRFDNAEDACKVFLRLFSSDSESISASGYLANHADTLSKSFFFIPAIIASVPLFKKQRIQFCNTNAGFIVETIVAFIIFCISISFLVASTYNPFIYFRF